MRSSAQVPRFQREGSLFLLVTFLVGVAALNTGNNLLYLVLILLLSFFICSGVLALTTLANLSVARHPPERVFAGSPALGELVVRNRKRLLPSFSILVTDTVQARGVPVAIHHVAKVEARGEVTAVVDYLFPRRGVEKLRAVRVSTRFPFGFLERGRSFWWTEEVLVYPRIERLDGESLLVAMGLEGQASRMKGVGQDIYAVRPFVQGDPLKHIHWKQTAKQSQLMAKDFESEDRRRVSVVLDLAPCLRGDESVPGLSSSRSRGNEWSEPLPRSRGEAGGPGASPPSSGANGPARPAAWEERIEAAIRLAASYTAHFLGRGFAVGFATHGASVPFGSGPEQTDRILATLARLDPYGVAGLAPITFADAGGREGVASILVRAAGNGSGMVDPARFTRMAET